MNIDEAMVRYNRDPAFKALVNMLEAQIEELRLSPSEIREAAMFAALRVEGRRPPSHFMDLGGAIRPMPDDARPGKMYPVCKHGAILYGEKCIRCERGE